MPLTLVVAGFTTRPQTLESRLQSLRILEDRVSRAHPNEERWQGSLGSHASF